MQVCSSSGQIPDGWFLSDCAVSGGSLETFIRQILKASGGRLCVRLHPVFMDFCLPCLSGTGTALDEAQLRRMHCGQNVYYSHSLCTGYFTCVADGSAHVVLYDTEKSLREKYSLLSRCGVPMVLIEDRNLRESLRTGFRN